MTSNKKTIKVIKTSKKAMRYTVNFTIKHKNKIRFIICLALLISNVGALTSLPTILHLPYTDLIRIIAPTIIERVIEIPVIY